MEQTQELSRDIEEITLRLGRINAIVFCVSTALNECSGEFNDIAGSALNEIYYIQDEIIKQYEDIRIKFGELKVSSNGK